MRHKQLPLFQETRPAQAVFMLEVTCSDCGKPFERRNDSKTATCRACLNMAESIKDREISRIWAAQAIARGNGSIILDTETTGLIERGKTSPRICQIAIINVLGGVLLDTFVNPEQPIPATATAIHGITDSMVATAPTWPAVWPKVERLTRGIMPLIYNAEYDTGVINALNRRYGLYKLPLIAECVMREYAAFVGEPSHKGGYKWQKLPALKESRYPAHSALGDCFATLALMREMAGK